MANNTTLNPGALGDVIGTEDIAGVKYELVKMLFGGDGVATKVSAANPLPTTDAAAEASLASIDGKLPAGGLATSAKQDTGNTSLASIDSKLTNPLPVSGTVVTGGLTDTQLRATPVPVSMSSDIEIGAVELKNGTDDTRATVTAANALKVDGSAVTQPVSAAALPLPTGAATSALQTQPGVDIGDVTINNAAGASAVNIQDGGNSITVDGTVAIGAGAAVIGHVITDTGSTTAVTGNVAVTNAGLTNIDVALSTRTKPADQQHTIVDSGTLTAVTAITNALPAGSNIIGNVRIDQTTPGTTNGVQVNAALPAGANAIGKLAANDGVDIGDTTINNAAGAAAVNIQDGGNSITVDGAVAVSGTVAATQSGTWNIGTVTTVSTLSTITNPIGIKGADGSAIASNANPVPISDAGGSLTVDNAGTFAVQSTVVAITPGTGSTNLGKAEDSVFTDGDVGVMNLGVREDVPSTTTNTNGDYVAMKTDVNGRLWINSDVLGAILNRNNELLTQLLNEARIQTSFLAQGLNISDNPDNYRNDNFVVNMF